MNQKTKREQLTADIVMVGAGIASLSCALHMLRRAEAAQVPKPTVLILEKGMSVGAHVLSGSVLQLRAFKDLLSDEELQAMPIETLVTRERFIRLSERKGLPLPFAPPPMTAKSLPMCSMSKVTRWLGTLCEAAGAEIYTDLAVTNLLYEDDRVCGVQVGDKGLDRDRNPKKNFEPGAEIRAKAVILGEGACGYLTEKLIQRHRLDKGSEEQTYALGIKELIRTPKRQGLTGELIHTFGYPLDSQTYGGGFVYNLSDTHVALGLVTALDYRDPHLNPHELFRAFKAHPEIRRYIEGGEVEAYGAKLLPERGYYSVPKLVTDGAMIVGDAAGLLDSVQLKGAHLSVRSGIAAGDTLFDCQQAGQWTEELFARYPERLRASYEWKTFRWHRNVRAWFQAGQLAGIVATGLAYITRGLLPLGRKRMSPDRPLVQREALRPIRTTAGKEEPLQLDVLSDMFYSGTEHEEDQPGHVVITNPEECVQECMGAYSAPCTRFCPAQVYERIEDEGGIRVTASNCLHCKTCQIKCPLDNIEWRLPEGGGGPRYKRL